MGVLKMDGGGKRELGEDIRKHVSGGTLDDGDGALCDEVSNIVGANVDMFGLGGGHGSLGEGDATVIVLVGDGRTSDRGSKGRKKLTEEHDLLGGGRESHVFGLSCG